MPKTLEVVTIDPAKRTIVRGQLPEADLRKLIPDLGWFTEPGLIWYHDDNGFYKHGLSLFTLVRGTEDSQPLAGLFIVTGTVKALARVPARVHWMDGQSHDYTIRTTSGPGPVIRSVLVKRC